MYINSVFCIIITLLSYHPLCFFLQERSPSKPLTLAPLFQSFKIYVCTMNLIYFSQTSEADQNTI